MKKILFLSLFFIIAFSVMYFCAISVQAVGCGSTNGVSPTKISVGDTVQCTITGKGTYYYFSLGSRTDVEITLTSSDGKARFTLWQRYGTIGMYFGDVVNKTSFSYSLTAGDWTIEVNPWTTQASTFTLKVTSSAPAAYCGDGNCGSGESCSSCSSDCGDCAPVLKSDGEYCETSHECIHACVHGVCRPQYPYCGDSYCDSGETCSNCSSDCGACAPVKKPIDSLCSNSSECESGYCAIGLCISASYCGNGYCDPWEDCSFCSMDCPVCTTKKYGETCSTDKECLSDYCHSTKKICCNASAWGCCKEASECGDGSRFICENFTCILRQETTETVKKSDGEYCDKSEECTSGNCQNYRCCLKNKTCCLSYNNCFSEQYCSEERHYCIPRLPDGQSCSEDSYCKSGNCKNYICCVWGQTCCKNHSDCDKNDYCQQETDYCRDKWSLGSACGDYGQDMCLSGYCDPETWKCAEKPPELKEEVVLVVPDSISLKKEEKQILVITIQNKTQKEIILGDSILIDNPIPASLEIDKLSLRLPRKKLLPNEAVSTEAKNLLDVVESLNLTGKSQGRGEIGLKMVYFVDNKANWVEGKVSISVIQEHVQKEEIASQVFNETMLLEETRGEYIFVSVEDKSLQQAAINEWQVANEEMKKAITNLRGHFTGIFTPEILSFFETIKSLEEAKSYQEITEASIRALAPPAIVAGFDFANLLDAIDRQKNTERGLLTHFDATDFVKVPIYDSQKNITGYTKAIVKEEDGKFYAVKVGDL